MSVKSTLAGLGALGVGVGLLYYFRDPIKDFILGYTGGIGKAIRCGVDFLGVFEDCKQPAGTQIGQDVTFTSKASGTSINCGYLGDNSYACEDALGKFTLKDPGTTKATIDGLSPSEYSLKALQNIGSTTSDQWTAKAKEAYNSLLLNLNLQDQTKLLSGTTGQPKYDNSTGIYQIGNVYAPLSQAALDYYHSKGVYPIKRV